LFLHEAAVIRGYDAMQAIAEVGIDIAAETPKRWTADIVEAVDVVITMGCGDTCPHIPGKLYELGSGRCV
jgi:arsenate reductase (thioredoxin)